MTSHDPRTDEPTAPDWARFTRGSALSVLGAASVSPTAAHRQAVVAPVVVALHRSRAAGTVPASAGDLTELLQAGMQMVSPATANDRFDPLDVRLGVRARFGSELFRLAPGGWERPLSIVDEAKLLAQALDPTLEAKFGFGLADVTELVLRHMDQSLRRLSAHWSPTDESLVSAWDREASVTEEEVTAAAADLDIASTVIRCRDSERAERALRWASCEPEQLSVAADSQAATFGPVVAVRHGDDFEALPVGFMIDALYAAMHTLREVALPESAAQARLGQVARARVLDLISGPGAMVAVNADAGAGPILALQQVHDGLLLAIDVVVDGLNGLGLAGAEDRLRAFVSGATARTARGDMQLDDDEEIVRLAVVVGPQQLMILRGDEEFPVNVMLAEDLRWILSRATRRDDLTVFLLDCQTPGERRFSFGMFDLWETWHGNDGAFHRVGAPLTMLMIEPHHERAEWTHHAEFGWLEDALVSLHLPGMTMWPRLSPDPGGALASVLTDRYRGTALDVAQLDNGIVVGVRYRTRPDGDLPESSIAHAILWKLRNIGGQASALVADDGPRTIRIELRGPMDLDGQTLAVVRTGDVRGLAYSEEFADELVRDSAAAERRIGRLLAAGLTGRRADDFVAAWVEAPPGIAVDTAAPPQRAQLLGAFQSPHGTFRAQAERAAASRLLAAGVGPGVRTSTHARDLESQQIYPVLQQLFRDAIAPFAASSLVRAALEDLERVHRARWHDEGHLGRLAALASPGVDVAAKVLEARHNSITAARALALTVEEALRDLPAGTREPRYLDLQRIYGIAYLMYESAMRSETIHQRVSGAELEITDSFELIARTADIDFDTAAFNRAVATAAPPQRLTAEPTDQPQETGDRTVEQAWPEIGSVDAALRAALGFGIQALLCVLDTVACWPVEAHEPVATTPLPDLVTAAAELTVGEPAEFEPAVQWLTLRPVDLQGENLEHWELDRRAVRLASRPLVQVQPGELLLCPWAASMTRRILLGHLSDGRLPWPSSVLPSSVEKQLRAYRRDRNTALERAVITALSNRPGLKVRGNVKKAKVIGLTVLPREIDGICVDESRARIWVLEAKDRTIAFSPHQQRTAIDEFHEPGGYIDKVIANVELIHAAATTVAKAMGASHPDQTWDVRGLIVTRRIEPAAYVRAIRVPFCTADTVAQTVDADDLPTCAYEVAIDAGSA